MYSDQLPITWLTYFCEGLLCCSCVPHTKACNWLHYAEVLDIDFNSWPVICLVWCWVLPICLGKPVWATSICSDNTFYIHISICNLCPSCDNTSIGFCRDIQLDNLIYSNCQRDPRMEQFKLYVCGGNFNLHSLLIRVVAIHFPI